MKLFRKNIGLINLVLFVVSNSLFVKEVVITTSFFKYILLVFDLVLLVLLIFSFGQKSERFQYSLFGGLIVLFTAFALLIRLENKSNLSITIVHGKNPIHENKLQVPSTWETDSDGGLVLRISFLNSDVLSFSMSPDFQEVYYLYSFSQKELVLRNIETKKTKFDWIIKSFNSNSFTISEDGEDLKFTLSEN